MTHSDGVALSKNGHRLVGYRAGANRGMKITRPEDVPHIGAMSFCRYCRGIVWSGDAKVFYAQGMGGLDGEIGDYYAHEGCRHEYDLQFHGSHNPVDLKQPNARKYPTYLPPPVPAIFSVDEFRELVRRVAEKRLDLAAPIPF